MPDTPIEKELACHARRHMDAEFRVYDAMMAMAISGWNKAQATGHWPDGRPWQPTDPLICYARVYTLANMTNRSTTQVEEALDKLESKWASQQQITSAAKQAAGSQPSITSCWGT